MFIYGKVKRWLIKEKPPTDQEKLNEIAQKCEALDREILVLWERLRQAYLKLGMTNKEVKVHTLRKPRKFNYEKRQYG